MQVGQWEGLAGGLAGAVVEVVARVREEEQKARRKGLKAATKMMMAIVASYLVCNLLNLVITFWEIVDPSAPTLTLPSLGDVGGGVIVRAWLLVHRQMYERLGDVVTLLTIINASLRLPIYYACNPKIRAEVPLFPFPALPFQVPFPSRSRRRSGSWASVWRPCREKPPATCTTAPPKVCIHLWPVPFYADW